MPYKGNIYEFVEKVNKWFNENLCPEGRFYLKNYRDQPDVYYVRFTHPGAGDYSGTAVHDTEDFEKQFFSKIKWILDDVKRKGFIKDEQDNSDR